MSRRPSITPAILDAARALRSPPEELGVREAALRLKVSKTALAAALKAGVAPTGSLRAPKPPKPPRKPKASPAAKPAPAIAHPKPPAPEKPKVEPRIPVPAPPPIALAADPLDELRRYAEEVRGRQKPLEAGSKEFRDLGAELRKTIAQMEQIRKGRPASETEAGRREAARPVAEGALGKIRSGVQAFAAREAEQGKCCRCGAELAPDIIVRRRVEAGLAEPAPH